MNPPSICHVKYNVSSKKEGMPRGAKILQRKQESLTDKKKGNEYMYLLDTTEKN